MSKDNKADPNRIDVEIIDPSQESERPVNQPIDGEAPTEIDADLVGMLEKTVLVGLTYFDFKQEFIQQRQISGTVVRVTPQDGITLRFPDGKTEFTLPSDLSCWFKAPEGRYFDQESNIEITNPDFLITWDVHQVQDKSKPDGQHEWWEWKPRTVPPAVGQKN
ncbi:hypothetical protein C2869_18790 [Saccharobesus litoralis]|uniref:Uncharacterized protein n=1 Tax=Saccharobesus litoralis TaxID=2172099 RepID=A0A2S0VVU7_9ALTE|nr:hypothetical protein [Saccharobesus litoralis]AWB68328.1 hypothetical protein C2869_18790 [Saccharobesus litoralis]